MWRWPAALMPVMRSDAARGDHGAFDLLRVAVIEDQVCAEAVDAFLVTVQFVGLDGRQAVGEHAVVERRLEQRVKRLLDLVRLAAHERDAGPGVEQINVVGDAAAEIAVVDLTIVDVPVARNCFTRPSSSTWRNAHSGTPAGGSGCLNGGRGAPSPTAA